MRIDLDPSALPELTRSSASAGAAETRQPAVPDPAGVTTASDDVATLSTGSDSVQRLKTQLDAVPDARQQQAESLRQAVADGSFKVSPEHIAQAMLEGEDLTPTK